MPDGGPSMPAADPAPTQAEPALPPSGRKRALLRWSLLVLGPVVVVAGAVHFYLAGGRYATTDNAYVRIDKITIAPEVAGTVARVSVGNDQAVKAGDILFQLDEEPYRIAAESASAQRAMAGNELAALQAAYRERLSGIAKAEADVAYYQREFERQKELAKRDFASQSKLDEALRNISGAQQQQAMLRSQATAALAALDGNPDAPIETYSRYRYAQAQAEKAERDLRMATVRAPRAGIATNVDRLQKGMYLAVGQPALTVIATDHVWVEANPKESDLTHVRAGQAVLVTIDTYPDRVWRGVVETISPATGAEFSVLPAQNTSGNWIKVVQRIPVRVRLDLPDGAPLLRAGMSAYVEIDTGQRRSMADLTTMVEKAFAGGVDRPR